MRQLIFDLARPPSYDASDFLESPSNADALAMVMGWPDWPHRILLLVGPSGCGKSHLGSIWATRAGALTARAGNLLSSDHIVHTAVAFVEDCDRAGYDESAFFHLLNLARERRGWLLLSARTQPDRWGLRTPDLLSRLRLAPSVSIGRPDPTLMRAVMVKLFADRQIHIEEDVVAYAARHCEQSLEAVEKFVSAVDDESLAAGRRITRPLAAQAIARLSYEKPTFDDERWA